MIIFNKNLKKEFTNMNNKIKNETKLILSTLLFFFIISLILNLITVNKILNENEFNFNNKAIEKGLIQYEGDWVTEKIAKMRINLKASNDCYNNRYDSNMEECCNRIDDKDNPEMNNCCNKGEILY